MHCQDLQTPPTQHKQGILQGRALPEQAQQLGLAQESLQRTPGLAAAQSQNLPPKQPMRKLPRKRCSLRRTRPLQMETQSWLRYRYLYRSQRRRFLAGQWAAGAKAW